LPPHNPRCFGCGPESENGLHVVNRRVGDEVHATYTFAEQFTGAPGIAHGGTVAALVDDVCGGLLFVVREPAVTRKLEVEYLKPVLIGVQYELVARVDRRDGRKLWLVCEGRGPDGELVFLGHALFLIVAMTHFKDAVSETQQFAP
jgi:acyl-coenzyme A thioesterase PaaI-like protein